VSPPNPKLQIAQVSELDGSDGREVEAVGGVTSRTDA